MFSHPRLYTPWAVQPLTVAWAPDRFAKCDMSASLLSNDQASYRPTDIWIASVCAPYEVLFNQLLKLIHWQADTRSWHDQAMCVCVKSCTDSNDCTCMAGLLFHPSSMSNLITAGAYKAHMHKLHAIQGICMSFHVHSASTVNVPIML